MANEQLELKLNHYWTDYQAGHLTKGDVVSLFMIAYNELFPVENWLSWSPTRKHSDRPLYSKVIPRKHPDLESHPFFKKITESKTLGSYLNQSTLKKETLRAAQGLIHVYADPDTIQILDYIPTPIQVLEMQSNGFRCVTLLRTKEWFYHQFDHKRNIRDFVIHDLEHIWQMFEDPKMTAAQILFSSQLLELVKQGQFNFLETHPEHSKEFNYIMSDMNTHPAHMHATLKSLLQRSKNEIHLPLMKHFDPLLQSLV